MATTPPPATAKKKAVPTWYYVAGVVGIVAAYYLYSKSKASSAASAAAPVASAGSGTAAGSYGNAGDLAALAPYLNQQSGSGASGTTGGYTIPTGLTLEGSGYGFSPSDNSKPSTTVVPSTSGANYIEVASQNIQQLAAGGQTVYYQPAPGVFTPIPAGAGPDNLGGLVGNTPLYIQQGTSVGSG